MSYPPLSKHLDQISIELSNKIQSILTSWSARGFSQIGGSAVRQLLDAGIEALQSLYDAATTIAPSVQPQDVVNFIKSFGEALDSLSQTAISRAPENAYAELTDKKQHLTQQLQLKLV